MNLKSTTKFRSKGERGNCLAATLASILDLEISEVPQFEEMAKEIWRHSLHEWSSSIGVRIEFTKSIPNGFCIGIGRHKTGDLHAVILKDGCFYFDPNGTGQYYNEHKYCIVVEKQAA